MWHLYFGVEKEIAVLGIRQILVALLQLLFYIILYSDFIFFNLLTKDSEDVVTMRPINS